ncbi:MAG: hypothetical protein JRH06_13905 [Deltaproteobacteria bacterium]|nr:hypothetical protein [Deltaproteobacteria bacterium]MBW2138634.1 hypothetical protein [Deltaproteobacteria bacterium]
MADEKISWGKLIIKDAVRAATWSVVVLIVLSIFLLFVKQEVKQGIDFGAKRAVSEAVKYATDPYLVGKGKQLVKEGIEYTVDKVGDRYQQILLETIRATQTMQQPQAKQVPQP